MENFYRTLGNTVIVYVKHRDGNISAFQISLCDLEKVDSLPGSWHIRTSKNGRYVIGLDRNTKKKFYLHRWLMDTPKGQVVDHINRDTLDNRRENLRNTNYRTNILNSKLRKDNDSGHRGVSFHKQTGKWRANVWKDGKQLSLGLYHSIDEAAEAVENARKVYV